MTQSHRYRYWRDSYVGATCHKYPSWKVLGTHILRPLLPHLASSDLHSRHLILPVSYCRWIRRCHGSLWLSGVCSNTLEGCLNSLFLPHLGGNWVCSASPRSLQQMGCCSAHWTVRSSPNEQRWKVPRSCICLGCKCNLLNRCFCGSRGVFSPVPLHQLFLYHLRTGAFFLSS